jgi:hypothetical protein
MGSTLLSLLTFRNRIDNDIVSLEPPLHQGLLVPGIRTHGCTVRGWQEIWLAAMSTCVLRKLGPQKNTDLYKCLGQGPLGLRVHLQWQSRNSHGRV